MQDDGKPKACEEAEIQSNGAPKFSFSMNMQKKQEVVIKRTTTTIFAGGVVEDAEDEERRTQKRGVVYMENGEIRSNEPFSKKGKTAYVIPMKATQNDWRIERLKKIVEEGNASEEDKARLALLIDSINGERSSAPIVNGLNHVISVEETKDEEEDEDADYDQVPIGEFGLAFLRGCGWKEETGIGKTNKKAVSVKIHKARPVRLGLGAERKDPSKDDSKSLKPGVLVEFISGPDRKRLGTVKSMDEDNASCYVELDRSGGKVVVVSQYLLEVKSKALKTESNGSSRQRK
jgi:hypothetical protein